MKTHSDFVTENTELGHRVHGGTQDILAALRRRHAKDPIFVERKRDFLNLFTESDAVVATMAGQLIEYEVKATRSDFSRDAHKLRNRIYAGLQPGGRPNRFYYATARGIIDETCVPAWAGWYELIDGELVLRRKAPRLNKEVHDTVILLRLARAMRRRESIPNPSHIKLQTSSIAPHA